MRITEKQVNSGYFWLPSNPEKKLPGNLTFTDGGNIELEIIGNFDAEIKSFQNDWTLPRIVGEVEKEGYITLDDCIYKQKNIPFGGVSKSFLYAHKALIGAIYEEKEEVTFTKFKFSTEGLDEWLQLSGIQVNYDWEKQSTSILYEPPEVIELSLSNGLKLTFTFSWKLPSIPAFKEAKITQTSYVLLSSEEPLPLSEFVSAAHKITNFLCFAHDKTVTINFASAYSPEITQKNPAGKDSEISIKIIYPSLPFSETPPKIDLHSMLFNFPQIRSNASAIFINWLNAYDEIEPAINLYFASKTGAHKYIDGQFLSLAQGLESYHRRTSDEVLMSPEEFNDLTTKILESCPNENRKWLSGRLKYGNEINLGRRLKKIIEPFNDLIGNSKNRSKLIRSIVNTRNYFTHFDESLKCEAAMGKKLWVICMKMEAIFQILFLKEIGFTKEQIISVTNKSRKLSYKIKEI